MTGRPRGARRPPRLSPARALRALEAIHAEFGGGAAQRKQALLAILGRARLATAREVLRLHDTLCFLRAYPDSRELLVTVERLLEAFDRRADLRRHRDTLEDSGIAGTRIRFSFFAPMAAWLTRRWPERLHVDWERFDDPSRLEQLLPLFAEDAESPAIDEFDFGLRGWIDRLKGPHETDAAFLVRAIERAFLLDSAIEKVWDGLDTPLVLEPAPGTPSRTQALAPGAPRAFQTQPLRRQRPDLRAELARPPRSVRALGVSAGQSVVDLARAAMVTRSRDLDAFSYGDPRDVRLVDCGDGLSFACIGVIPERRLLLESVYAFLTLKNAVPIGYVLSSALFGSAEIAYNVFETWRGAEAGAVYGRVLATVKHLFGVDSFTIYPYQLGQHNDEALESGAWWFYQKLGFRARDRKVLALMRAEQARMARQPKHRSSIATLRRLADENVYYHEGAAREDVIGILPMANVGLHVTRLIRERFDGDRVRAESECRRQLDAMGGAGTLPHIQGHARRQVAAWAMLVAAIPGVAKWSAAEQAALIEVVRAKAGRRESDFVHRFDAHPKLRTAIRAMALEDLSG